MHAALFISKKNHKLPLKFSLRQMPQDDVT